MLSKIFATAFIITVTTALPVWFLTRQGIELTSPFPVIFIFVFLISAASAWLSSRTTTLRSISLPRTKPQTSRSNSSVSNGRRESGSVKWFNASKGFGFITRDSGDDIFVHFRSIRGEGHRILRDGERVEFAVSEGDKGLQADDVAPAR